MGQLRGQEETTRAMSADLVSHDQGVAATDDRDTLPEHEHSASILPDLLRDLEPPQLPLTRTTLPPTHTTRSVACQVERKLRHSSMVNRNHRRRARENSSRKTDISAEDQVKLLKMKDLVTHIQVPEPRNSQLSEMMNKNFCMFDATKAPKVDSLLWTTGVTAERASSSPHCQRLLGLESQLTGVMEGSVSGESHTFVPQRGGRTSQPAQRNDGAGTSQSLDYPEVIGTYTQVTDYDETTDEACRARAMSLLRTSGSYFGKLSMTEARQKLKRSAVGTYLLRDTSDSNYFLALSVKTQRGTTSIRISYARGRFRLDCEETALLKMPSFDCIMKLIQYYNVATAKSKNQSCVFLESSGRKDTPVMLTRPYMESAPSLKHMCRCVLNRLLNEDQKRRLLIFMSPDIEDCLQEYPYFV